MFISEMLALKGIIKAAGKNRQLLNWIGVAYEKVSQEKRTLH